MSHGSFQLGVGGMGKSHCEQSVLFTCNIGTDDLLLQHALIHTKNFVLANQNVQDEGQASWFMKNQKSLYNVVFLKI